MLLLRFLLLLRWGFEAVWWRFHALWWRLEGLPGFISLSLLQLGRDGKSTETLLINCDSSYFGSLLAGSS